jgi:hypothetical protein
MIMSMNLSEYIRCKQIVNYLLGTTIHNVKTKIESDNLDFITF